MVSEEYTSISQPENPDTLDIVSDEICEKIGSCNMDIKVSASIEKVFKQHYCYHYFTHYVTPQDVMKNNLFLLNVFSVSTKIKTDYASS